jgi:hypothetical protein
MNIIRIVVFAFYAKNIIILEPDLSKNLKMMKRKNYSMIKEIKSMREQIIIKKILMII